MILQSLKKFNKDAYNIIYAHNVEHIVSVVFDGINDDVSLVDEGGLNRSGSQLLFYIHILLHSKQCLLIPLTASFLKTGRVLIIISSFGLILGN